MSEPPTNPPRVHLVSCLYVVTFLLALYLGALWFFLPGALTYQTDVFVSLNPVVHDREFLLILLALCCLAISYWERYLLITTVTGLLGIVASFGACTIFFRDASRGIMGNFDASTRAAIAGAARATADYSYFPLQYLVLLTLIVMVLRVLHYRPTTFRLTMLDMMLITIAIAVILGTRGLALRVYGLS